MAPDLDRPRESAPAAERPRPAVAVELAELECFSWARLFGVDGPVELEIGVGKAGFLLHRARAWPQRSFLGIEWAGEFYRHAVDRMERWRVPNVRILRTDASHFVRTICPGGSLTALHVYHPDPWPKKRHHKRRLFQPPFVDAAARCLIPGGRWAVQTDHAEYFAIIAALLQTHPLLEPIPFDDPDYGVQSAVNESGVGVATNFELKYRKEGRAIYQLAVRRRPGATT
jgi:tRNA (guanine-N7-)-methyltransferase